MKVKVLSGILIFSLALNLAVIGTFLYHRFDRPDAFFPPEGAKPPFIKDMDLDEDQRREMFELFNKFRRSSMNDMKDIFRIEQQLFDEIMANNINMNAVDSLNNLIASKKSELSSKAINNFIRTKKFLTKEQQEHFLKSLLQQRPRPFRHDRRPDEWRPDDEDFRFRGNDSSKTRPERMRK
ncbi:MAG: hypothetical protein H6627_06930 [Calditrichae bacterium]|nr:hypothetical protein [Calditrichia bacterium]